MTRAEKIIAFIERYCVTPEGADVGKPLCLAEFQRQFIRDVYDNPVGTRRAILSVARKNGKSGLIAGLLLAHLVGPEAKQNAQIASGALSKEQASLIFSLASKMVQLSPKLSSLVKIIPSGKRLIGLPLNVEYKALAADGKTAHGLSLSLALLDEIGQVRGPQSDFIDAITTSQGAHAEPLLIAISTQAASDADLFSQWIDDAQTSQDPRIVCHLYAAPEGCDLMDEAAWRAANPALGLFRSLDDLREQMTQAQRMPSMENSARNLLLNCRVSTVSPFISPDVWKVQCHFWAHEIGLADRARRDRSPYEVWHRQGFLRTTPGASIDYEHVATDMAEILADLDVRAIAFDRWRIDVLKKELDRIGLDLPLEPWGQGFASMAGALDTLEAELLNGRVRHGGHPVLQMNAANAVIVKDPAGNRKLEKSRSTGRIDGLQALAQAMGVASKATEAQGIAFDSFTFV